MKDLKRPIKQKHRGGRPSKRRGKNTKVISYAEEKKSTLEKLDK